MARSRPYANNFERSRESQATTSDLDHRVLPERTPSGVWGRRYPQTPYPRHYEPPKNSYSKHQVAPRWSKKSWAPPIATPEETSVTTNWMFRIPQTNTTLTIARNQHNWLRRQNHLKYNSNHGPTVLSNVPSPLTSPSLGPSMGTPSRRKATQVAMFKALPNVPSNNTLCFQF